MVCMSIPVLIKDPGEIQTAHVFRLSSSVSRICWGVDRTFVLSKMEVVKIPPSSVLMSVVVVGLRMAVEVANNVLDLP